MQAAVLVIDAQHDYMTPESRVGAEAHAQILEPLQQFLGQARARGLPVVHVITEFASPSNGNSYCVRGTPGWEEVPEVKSSAEEPVFAKQQLSGFENPELDAYLQENEINTLLLTGVSTAKCVRATAWDALKKGYMVKLVKECCAAPSAEEHNAAMRELEQKGALILAEL